MSTIDWDSFELEPLAAEIRGGGGGADAERTIWAFEQVLAVARVDGILLEHLLTAAICLVARAEECSPRTVLETYFRRAVPDEIWRERFLPLLDA
jgi:hypothetical protein